MDADAVLDNWSDIESNESDVSSEGSEESEESVDSGEESEESSAEEEDIPDSWREVPDSLPRPPTSFPFTAIPGLNIGVPRSASPLQFFELFMTINVWQYILETTNNYARVRLGSMPPTRRSVFRNWRDISMVEMRAFIGVIIQMGLAQLSDIKDYWSTHITLNFPFFRSVFSRDRFLQIFWMLHVGETPSASKRSKIQPFLNLLVPLFQRHLTPSRELSIDEAMIAFRGRVAFRQYIRGKPQPWGIKAYVLSESRTGYMYNLVIYYGKETQLLTRPGLNHTTNVVLTLMNPLANLGYDLYTDRFYTSPVLASELLHISTTLTGTVMTNRKNMPNAVKSKKQKKGEVDTYMYCKGPMVVIQWTDKRTLTALTTKHEYNGFHSIKVSTIIIDYRYT
jgi:hypothetical protein